MTDGEHYASSERQEQGMQRTVVTDLGPRNAGSFGPSPDLDEDARVALAEQACAEKYSVPATKRYICVDGRLSDEELDLMISGESITEADPQLAGGIVISEDAADRMDPAKEQVPQSMAIALKTQEAILDGIEVTVHGDENGKAGCRANVDERKALRFNAENADIVTPKVWAVSELLGLDRFIEQDDIAQSIVAGQAASEDDKIWDTTPEDRVQIIMDNGGTYIMLRGKHAECALRVDTTESAFAKAAYVRDHSTPEEQAQAFAASVGKYNKDAFERAGMHGRTEREAALQVMRVVLFNVGMSKMLLNEAAKAGLITETGQ